MKQTAIRREQIIKTYSLDYFKEGNLPYEKGDYKTAIISYQKAFELEKQNPQLTQILWRVLLGNLATSCGITGDLNKSKDVIAYGISKDPTYPLFYYNLACVYAESKDLIEFRTEARLAIKCYGISVIILLKLIRTGLYPEFRERHRRPL